MLAEHLIPKLAELIANPKDKFAIAFSGGGDSTALVHALKGHPQHGPVFIVDHALRAGSNDEAKNAKTFAQKCGCKVQIFTWQNNLPKTGLQEKARRARYGLMGEACREQGIKYLLTAHSRDDQAETLLMRYAKKTDWRGAAGMSPMRYGAVWPELAEVTICRPLLDISREELRDYNRAQGLSWVDDPSNENREFNRIQARDYLTSRSSLKDDFVATAKDLSLGLQVERKRYLAELKNVQFGGSGEITLSAFLSAEFMSRAMRCVGASGRSINRKKFVQLYQKLKSEEINQFTYLGAQVVRDGGKIILRRDIVAVTGRSDKNISPQAKSMPLTPIPQLWDGRFLISSKGEGYVTCPNYNLKIPRSKALKKSLASTHKSARPTTPVITYQNMAYALEELDGVDAKCLIEPRLTATL